MSLIVGEGMGIVSGFSIHDELRILVENGFSPYEALATGTINAAIVVQRMTGEGNFGVIEVGKRADLILVRGSPLKDITTIQAPMGVMAAGKWYSSERLAELTEKHFDLRQERRELQIAQLEAELEKVRATIDKRNEARELIIRRRVSRLLGEKDELDWGPSAASPVRTPTWAPAVTGPFPQR